MNDHDHRHEDQHDATATHPPADSPDQSKIKNPNSKIAETHPLGPDWIKKYNAIARHRQALQLLLVNAITDAASALADAAAGESPFHNEIEFRAAARLLDLLPALQHPHDIEMEALDRIDEQKARDREREATRKT